MNPAIRFVARQFESPRCVDCGRVAERAKLRCQRCATKRAKRAAYQRAYYERHKATLRDKRIAREQRRKAEIAARRRQWVADNRAKLRRYQRDVYQRTRDSRLAYQRAYYERNRAARLAYASAYRAKRATERAA